MPPSRWRTKAQADAFATRQRVIARWAAGTRVRPWFWDGLGARVVRADTRRAAAQLRAPGGRQVIADQPLVACVIREPNDTWFWEAGFGWLPRGYAHPNDCGWTCTKEAAQRTADAVLRAIGFAVEEPSS